MACPWLCPICSLVTFKLGRDFPKADHCHGSLARVQFSKSSDGSLLSDRAKSDRSRCAVIGPAPAHSGHYLAWPVLAMCANPYFGASISQPDTLRVPILTQAPKSIAWGHQGVLFCTLGKEHGLWGERKGWEVQSQAGQLIQRCRVIG